MASEVSLVLLNATLWINSDPFLQQINNTTNTQLTGAPTTPDVAQLQPGGSGGRGVARSEPVRSEINKQKYADNRSLW